jgi:DNA-binding HxlR family transcriptional regulator
MLYRDYEGQDFCGVAKTLEIVGERWSLLIVRDIFLGRRRFEEFRESLGIARNVLTDRLNRLVDEGVLERVLYSAHPERFEYRLTPKGLELNVALTALREWGERHVLDGPPRVLRRRSDGKAVTAALVPKGTKTVGVREVELAPR